MMCASQYFSLMLPRMDSMFWAILIASKAISR